MKTKRDQIIDNYNNGLLTESEAKRLLRALPSLIYKDFATYYERISPTTNDSTAPDNG